MNQPMNHENRESGENCPNGEHSESCETISSETLTTPDIVLPEDTAPSNDVLAIPKKAEAPSKKPSEFLVSTLFDYLEILVFSICAVLLIFTLFFRLCRVNGSSMRNTLQDGQMLITTTLTAPEPGDIIVFHMTSDTVIRYNEPMVKRVIARGGQTVRIQCETHTVYVDGIEVDEPYAAYLDHNGRPIDILTQLPAHHYDPASGIFEITVPEGYLFVMGDNRNNSADSRTKEIYLVDERRVLGRVICRLAPFTTFE